jgi:pre-rRNA-processing protein TSR4
MMKNNKKDFEDYFVSLGFAEKPNKNDLEITNFPSKLGGQPLWMIPPELNKFVSEKFFECNICKSNLTFLIQLYCPLEDNKNAYHRYLYVFYCSKCWLNETLSPGVAVKVLRIQLPENSEFFSGTTCLVSKQSLLDNESAQKINQSLLNCLSSEFVVETDNERIEATKAYIKFYDKIDEKSMNSKTSLKDFDEDDDEDMEDEEQVQGSVNDENIKNMIKKYYEEEGIYYDEKNLEQQLIEEEAESEMIGKMQKEIFKMADDMFYDTFCKVVEYDPKQVVRYCREDVIPLWFNQNGMVTVRNLKCKNCKGDLIFEFQIMPNIFNICKEIRNSNIGTIVIYTCKNSCSFSNNPFMEEYAFIQRTGEKVLELDKSGKVIMNNRNPNKTQNLSNPQQQQISNEELIANLNKITVKGNENNEPDEEGFVEVKKKKKK